MRHVSAVARGALVAAGLLVAAANAHAQIGSGWSSKTYTKKIHLDDESGLHAFSWTTYKSVCSPVCADYRFSNDVETFRLIDNRTNRAEIRLQNEYSTGTKQFQGYVTFGSPLNDESLFQIFGSTSGATLCMMRGYSSSGGSIKTVGGGGTLATGVYGHEQRINVIHVQGSRVEFYVGGSKKATISDGENVTNYWKYGCYGTLRTGAVSVRWRSTRFWSK
jgi:hypothetical protein